MKRRNLNLKEEDQLQRVKIENKRLKKEVQTLRKELNRLEHRFSGLDELVEQQYDEDNTPKAIKEAKKDWSCFKCKEGQLKIFIINKVGVPHYFRKCDSCENRTKLKKYSSEVEE